MAPAGDIRASPGTCSNLNYSNTVSFFLFLWSVYTLLGANKRYGLQPEIGISSVLTLYLH